MAWPLKSYEMNRIAAFFHLATFLLACTALAQSAWFRVRGMQCTPHLALSQFFGFGSVGTTTGNPVPYKFQYGNIDEVMMPPVTISYYYTSNATLACVSSRIASLMRIIILLCFMVMIFSAIGIFLNVASLKNETLKIIRRNGILSVFCVMWVIAIVGVCYYTTLLIEEETSGGSSMKNVDVSYEYGFYTITAAGVISILGTATNLLSASSPEHSVQTRNLIDDWDGLDSFNIGRASSRNNRNIVIVNAGTGAFVPTAPRRGRGTRSGRHPGGSASRALVGDVSPDGDLAMLTPPPPYTPDIEMIAAED